MQRTEIRIQLERHHKAGFGWALNCCSWNQQEAEDVLQTVYLKILQERARFDGKADFKTWFFSVIRKTALDARRRKRLHFFKLSTYKNQVINSEDSFYHYEENEDSHLQAELKMRLTDLPRRQREVLLLVFYHNQTLKQVAEILDLSIGTVRTHYERGKRQLRQKMNLTGEIHETR